MNRKGIVLVATDTGPQNGLLALKKALDKAGHFTVMLESEADLQYVGPSDLLVSGMSSTEELARLELASIAEAKHHGKPVVLYADTFGVINRPWFGEAGPRMVFVVNEREARKANSRFSSADDVVTGNPEWEKFFALPEKSEKIWRAEVGITDDSPVIFNALGKDPVVNISVTSALVDATVDMPVHLVVGRHPRDETPGEVYSSLATFGGTHFMTADVLPFCNMVIESASTVGVEAACRRKPIVSVFSVVAERRLEQSTGSKTWPLCEEGCSVWTRPAELRDKIGSLFEDSSAIRLRQAEVFPVLQPGLAVQRMIEAIEDLLD